MDNISQVTPDYPWERMPDETQKAYAAFAVYLKIPPYKRSIRGAVRELKGELNLSTLRIFSAWSSKYNWVYRSGKWDDFCVEEERRVHIQGVKEMRSRHLRVAQALFTNGVQRLKMMDAEEIKSLNIDDMFRLLSKGYEMERETMGLNVEEIEVWEANKRVDSLSAGDQDFAELSTVELRHYLIQHRKVDIPGTLPTIDATDE